MVAVGSAAQDAPAGQMRFRQAGCLNSLTSVEAPHPSWQVQRLVDAENVPCPLQEFSQSVFCGEVRGGRSASRKSSGSSGRRIAATVAFIRPIEIRSVLLEKNV